MAVTTGRQSAPQRNNGVFILVIVAVTAAVLAAVLAGVLLTRNSGGTATSTVVNTTANVGAQAPASSQSVSATTRGYKFGEYSRPSSKPLPQIEDPTEMIASNIWIVLAAISPDRYPWATALLQDPNRNLSEEARAVSRNETLTPEAKSAMGSIAGTGVVTKLRVDPVPAQEATETIVPTIVTITYKDMIYGTEETTRFYVVAAVAERGFWESVRFAIYGSN